MAKWFRNATQYESQRNDKVIESVEHAHLLLEFDQAIEYPTDYLYVNWRTSKRRFMMKLLKTGNINIVEECMFYFNFQSVCMRIAARTVNFAKRFAACQNTICQMSLVL